MLPCLSPWQRTPRNFHEVGCDRQPGLERVFPLQGSRGPRGIGTAPSAFRPWEAGSEDSDKSGCSPHGSGKIVPHRDKRQGSIGTLWQASFIHALEGSITLKTGEPLTTELAGEGSCFQQGP